ncbi:hypothetical protein J8273_1085 [Carpediemonas membranifera]|uniref:Exportin-5 C-terminal domain-containing protein n=1 Tax=Carpediemonas membranifera TaxID=201153 RepID=A0A8J6C133_9EUKA|nr:hypothetical protein J8273_1085 [Carpediemonas membranifera]|eukprot:KAG9397176.1 hypothetical protein J8273_1085 [Carpediemonas membranifera]
MNALPSSNAAMGSGVDDTITAALMAVFDPAAPAASRQEAQQYLDAFRSNTGNLDAFFALSKANDPQARHFGLSALSDFLERFFLTLDLPQRDLFRQSTLSLTATVDQTTPVFVKNKIGALLGGLMFIEWPQCVSDYPMRLGADAEASDSAREVVLYAFRTLSECVAEKLPNLPTDARRAAITAVSELSRTLLSFIADSVASTSEAVCTAAIGLTAVLGQWMPMSLLLEPPHVLSQMVMQLNNQAGRIGALEVLDVALRRPPEGQHDVILSGVVALFPAMFTSLDPTDDPDYYFFVQLVQLFPSVSSNQYNPLRPHVPAVSVLLGQFAEHPSHAVFGHILQFFLKILRDDKSRKAVPDEIWHRLLYLCIHRLDKKGGPSEDEPSSLFAAIDFGDDDKWADYMGVLIGRAADTIRLLAPHYPAQALWLAVERCASQDSNPDPGQYPSPTGHCTTKSPGYATVEGALHGLEAVVSGIETAATAEGVTIQPYTNEVYQLLLQALQWLTTFQSQHAIVAFRVVTALIPFAAPLARLSALQIEGDPVEAVIRFLLQSIEWRGPHEANVDMVDLSQDTLSTRRRACNALLTIVVQSPAMSTPYLEIVYRFYQSGCERRDSQGFPVLSENERATLVEAMVVASGSLPDRQGFIFALLESDYNQWTSALQTQDLLAVLAADKPDLASNNARPEEWATRRKLHFSMRCFVSVLRRLMFPAMMSHGRSQRSPLSPEISDADRPIVQLLTSAILPIAVQCVAAINRVYTGPRDPRLDSFPQVEVNGLLGKIGTGSDLRSDMDHPDNDLLYIQYLLHELYELSATFIGMACKAGCVTPDVVLLILDALPQPHSKLFHCRCMTKRLLPELSAVISMDMMEIFVSKLDTIIGIAGPALAASASSASVSREAIEEEMVIKALGVDVANGVGIAISSCFGVRTVGHVVQLDQDALTRITGPDPALRPVQLALVRQASMIMTWGCMVATKKTTRALEAAAPHLIQLPELLEPVVTEVLPIAIQAVADPKNLDFTMEIVGLVCAIHTSLHGVNKLHLMCAELAKYPGYNGSAYEQAAQRIAGLSAKKQRKVMFAFLQTLVGQIGEAKQGSTVSGVSAAATAEGRVERAQNKAQAADFMMRGDINVAGLMGDG